MSAGGADDGEAGEGDEVTAVENLNAGSGDDVIVGTSAVNIIEGRAGADQLFGLENHDHLLGGPGDDYLQGDAGRNTLRGDEGNDVLVGNATSDDRYFAGDGDDEIVGNTDGIRENVDCGAGIDTVEANAEDNFTACEGL
jgi:Ca2+-binding RTX toxin-like protein